MDNTKTTENSETAENAEIAENAEMTENTEIIVKLETSESSEDTENPGVAANISKPKRNKRAALVTAIIAVGVFIAVVATALILGMSRQPDTGSSNQLKHQTEAPTIHEATSSRFGQKVDFPNHFEVQVGVVWLNVFMDYDDLLAKAKIVKKIAAVVDPSLTAAHDKFPQARVDKMVYNGLMTIRVLLDQKGDPAYGLNFDLHTGEQVDLRSVFADNFDAQTVVDRAVQPFILSYDEQNIHRFKGVDLEKTSFTLDTEGIWLIFDESSLFLAGKSIYLEWHRFGEGAIAVFDRFVRLEQSEIASGFDNRYEDTRIFKSEPTYLAAQNTNFYLPIQYENDYERELAEEAKKFVLANPALAQGEYPIGGFYFKRIENYRLVSVGYWTEDKQVRMGGSYNVKEKRELTLAEYLGDDYEQKALASFRQELANENVRAVVTEQEFVELLKTVKINAIMRSIIFTRSIMAYEHFYHDKAGEMTLSAYEIDTLYMESKQEWWR